jgi:RNA polymerase sigma factor for flagellar operon FliA
MMKAMINRYREANLDTRASIDDAAREVIICEHASQVRYIAERIALRLPPHISKEELISAGTMGLIDALNDYDFSKGTKFKTYASYRIKGAMLDELRRLDWVPRSVRRDIKRIEKAVAALWNKLGRQPRDVEIAAELGINIQHYYKMLQKTNGINLISLDDRKSDEAGSLLNSFVAETPSPFESLKKKELKKTLANVLEKLSKKEQLVMSLYYYDELTLKEIAEILGLTESRISQIHSKAIISLRIKLKKVIE